MGGGRLIVLFVIALLSGRPVKAQCAGKALEISGGFGQVQSPNYPDEYGKSANCTWKFSPPSDGKEYLLLLTVTKMKTYFIIDGQKRCSESYNFSINNVQADCYRYAAYGSSYCNTYYRSSACASLSSQANCEVSQQISYPLPVTYSSDGRTDPTQTPSSLWGFRMNYEYIACSQGTVEQTSDVPVTTDPVDQTSGDVVTTGNANPITEGTVTTECFKDIIEVIFVVDGSESIGLENFQLVKQWLVNVTKALIDQYQRSVRTEVLQYSDKDGFFSGVKIDDSQLFVIPYTLNDELSIEEMERRINNMPYLKDKTYTYYALRRVMEVEFPRSEYYNSSIKIVVVLTDGTANDALFLKDWYDRYEDNVTSFAIGVAVEGKTNFLTQLRIIANGGTSDERVLSVKNFDDLQSIVGDLNTGINNAANQTDLAPCPTILPTPEPPSTDLVHQTSDAAVTTGPVDQTSGATMTTDPVEATSDVPVTTGPVDQTSGDMMTTAGPFDQTLGVTVKTDTVDQTTRVTTPTGVVEPSAMCPNASSNCDSADVWMCEHFYQKKILSEWMEKYLIWWRTCPDFGQRNWDHWASSIGLKHSNIENDDESQQGSMDGYGEMGFIRMMKANIRCYNYSSIDCDAGETFYDVLGCKHCYHRGLKGRNTRSLFEMWKQGFLQHKTLMKIYNALSQECSGSYAGCAEESSSVPDDETTTASVHPTYSPP